MRRLLPVLAVQMVEDSGDDVGVVDAGNDLDCTAAMLTDFNIDKVN